MKNTNEVVSLADRMKGYEKTNRPFVNPDGLILMRLDGKNFSNYTKNLQRPFDVGFIEDMNEVAIALMNEIQGAIFAYIQSDEISIFIWNKAGYVSKNNNKSQIWFNGNVQKMTSISAGRASAKFNHLRLCRLASTSGGDYQVPVIDLEALKKFRLAEFDSRVFEVPYDYEVANNFIWRQQDFMRNSVFQVARTVFSHKQLDRKSSMEVKEMLLEQGISWENDFPAEQKYGRMVVKGISQESKRGKWIVKPAPIFTENKDILYGFLCFVELVEIEANEVSLELSSEIKEHLKILELMKNYHLKYKDAFLVAEDPIKFSLFEKNGMIAFLKTKTGAGEMDCKKALERTNWNLIEAEAIASKSRELQVLINEKPSMFILDETQYKQMLNGDSYSSTIKKCDNYMAVKIAVVESEAGWGRKIDDWMVCQSIEDAKLFKTEYNAKNTSKSAPDWYMQVEGNSVPIELNEAQYQQLLTEGCVWLSSIENLK